MCNHLIVPATSLSLGCDKAAGSPIVVQDSLSAQTTTLYRVGVTRGSVSQISAEFACRPKRPGPVRTRNQARLWECQPNLLLRRDTARGPVTLVERLNLHEVLVKDLRRIHRRLGHLTPSGQRPPPRSLRSKDRLKIVRYQEPLIVFVVLQALVARHNTWRYE